jgi:PKD repeat protein
MKKLLLIFVVSAIVALLIGTASAALGDSWNEVNGSAPFPKWSFAAGSNGTAIMIVGGSYNATSGACGSSCASGGVWVGTNNATSWIKTNSTAFPDLNGARVVWDSNTSAWIMIAGGDVDTNDPIAISSESFDGGYTWKSVTSAWLPRTNAGLVYDKSTSSTYLMGGMNNTATFTDVWKLVDGNIAWTMVTTNGGYGTNSLGSQWLAINGTLIKIGGYGFGYSPADNTVQSSTNHGLTWTTINSNAPWSGRGLFDATNTTDGSIYITDGMSAGETFGSSTVYNDLWCSRDLGATWSKVSSITSKYPASVEGQMVTLNDGNLYEIGGANANNYNVVGGIDNEIWKTVISSDPYLDTYQNNLKLLLYNNATPFTDFEGHSISITGTNPTLGNAYVPWKPSPYYAMQTGPTSYINVSSGQSDFAWGAPGTSGNFTILVDFNITTRTTGDILWDQRPTGTTGYYPLLYIVQQESGGWNLTYDVNGNDVIKSYFILQPNTEYQAVIERNGTTTTEYLNGVSNGTWSDTSTYINGANRPTIGGRGYSEANGFHGLISEVAAWNTVIPIQQLFPQTQEILSSPLPVTFSSNATSGFVPLSVSFQNTAMWTYPGLTFENWSINNGTQVWQNFTASGVSDSFIYTFPVVGTYQVNLTLTNNALLSNTSAITIITVNTPVPVSSFTANATTGVNYLPVQFTDTSTGFPTTWNWSYQGIAAGNNTRTVWSTLQNVTGIFGVGNFSIALNVTNSQGYNLSTQSTWINVTSNVTAITSDFTPNQTIGYQYPLPLTFIDNSTGATTWNYSFGDTYTSALQSPSHIYTVANLYTIRQNVTNATGSYATSTKTVNLTTDDDIWLKSWLQFENVTVIDLQGVVWASTGNAAISTATKKFGTQSLYIPAANPSSYISSPSSSIWDRSLIAGELEFWINITSIGQANQPILRRSSNAGGGTSNGWGFFNINATQNGYAFWYGNGATNYTTPFTIPTNTWTHVVLVRNTSQYWNVYLNGVKVNGGTYVGGLALDTANPFTIGANEGGTRFGFYLDEFRYTQGVPRFVSDFSVPYAAYNGNLYQNYVNINPNATLLYKSWPGYAQTIYNTTPHIRTVQITNLTNATAISLSINFPNIYENSGTPYVNTTDYPDLVLSNVTTNNIEGYDSFTISRSGNGGISALFNNRTNLVDIPVIYLNYTPDLYFDTYFASGSVTDGQHSVTYPIFNFYDTLLPVGAWTIYSNFTSNVTTAEINDPIQFTDTSLGEPSVWTSWQWVFGDGGTSNNQNPVHSYSAIGTYNVSLTSSLVANTSVTNTTTKSITVLQVAPTSPVASFTASPLVIFAGSSVQFTDTSTHSPSSWKWAFGDGNQNTNQNPLYTYSSVGNYTVNLTVSNAYGNNTLSKSNYISVISPTAPVANFSATPTSGNIPLIVVFSDSSTKIPSSWYWIFGDGSTSTLQNPTHIYTTVGIYSVNLTATNAYGSNSMVKNSYIVATSGAVANGRQDVILTNAYNITLYAKDANSGNLISYAAIMDETGKSLTSYGNGVFTGYYSAGQHVFTANATNYYTNRATYLVNGNLIQTIYLTLVSSSVSTTWYTPKTVSAQMVDVYGNALSGASVTAHYNQTTLPNGVSDLISNYGMNANVANEALNGTLIMSGNTDSSGSIVFTMLGTINYDITVTYGGNTNYYHIYPQEANYQFKFIVPSTADNIWNDLYANGNTKVWATEPDIGNVTFWWSFQDITALTTRIDFYLKDSDLNTTVYMTNITSPVAGSIYQLNYTVLNERGKNYIAWENYTRSV